MRRKLEAVATRNGTKPHEIISGADQLDAVDMPYFQKATEAFEKAKRAQIEAQQLAIEAQGISKHFYSVVSEKYGLKPNDEITREGKIVRKPYAEPVRS